ncbi:hypothetical protein ABT263_03785 [Kitasatospora sp. NPDC001603]|uniref:hypothetical protein n=1 Tax=Kitasatospora sp. NPDC001603 TaxID=3154388 RepID=UPI00331E1DA7
MSSARPAPSRPVPLPDDEVPALRPLIALLAAIAATLVIGRIVDQALQRVAASHPDDAVRALLCARCRIPLQLGAGSALTLSAAPRERILHRHDDGPHHLVPLFLLGSVGRLAVRVVAAGLEAAFSRDEPAPTTAHGGAPRSRRDPGPGRP